MNNNTKHTPGPWKFGRTSDKRIPSWYITGDGSISDVALVSVLNDTARKMEEHEANARLISAAPELLDALESLASEEYRDDNDPILGMVRAKARSAIAKAKGEA